MTTNRAQDQKLLDKLYAELGKSGNSLDWTTTMLKEAARLQSKLGN